MRRAVVATCTAALILLSLGAVYTTSTADESPEARTAKAIHDSTPEVVDVAAFLRPGSSTSTGVQRAIDSASRGDTVLFPAGVVDLDRPIRFASNLTYAAAEKGTTLRSVARGGLLIEHSPRVPLANVTIRGLRFDNIRIRLTGADDLTGISNVTFSGCAFVNGSESRDWHDAYLTLTYTDSVTVDSCQFLRSRGHGGRGVIIDKAQLTVVKDSWFGTTPNLEPGAPNGYFRTAINITGHDVSTGVGTHDTVIDGNTWRRTPGAVMPPSCTVCQDHGLYAWGSDRLFIVGNRADGWEASSAGGSMKLRNQQDTFVIGNHLKSSGILTYVYASQIMPTHLNRVMIRDNVIDLEGSLETCGHYCGINFWRNFGTGDSAHEENVMIRDNTFTKGGSITVADAHGPAFCVVANNNALLDFLTRGVRKIGRAHV